MAGGIFIYMLLSAQIIFIYLIVYEIHEAQVHLCVHVMIKCSAVDEKKSEKWPFGIELAYRKTGTNAENQKPNTHQNQIQWRQP